MKTIRVIVISAFCLILSCKKDAGKIDCWFGLNPPDNYRDSISSILIRYSSISDFKDDQELNNPDLFRYSSKIDSKSPDYGYPNLIHYGYITLDIDQTYVIKKFDLVDSSGKILFYLPWKPDSVHESSIPYLPFVFKAKGFMSISVVKYPDN
jgi:hypothetical protein